VENTGQISETEFIRLGDVLDLKFKVAEKTYFSHTFPEFTSSSIYINFSHIMKHPYFDYGIDSIIILNVILTAVQLWAPNVPFSPDFELIFTLIYFTELLLKVVAFGGFKEYWAKQRNRFDGGMTAVSLVLELVNISFTSSNDYRVRQLTQVVRLGRVARLLRLLSGFEQYRTLAGTYFSLLPVLIQLGGVFIVIYYSFGLVGVASFGGKMSLNSTALNNTTYHNNNYYVLNFNDFVSAIITLFALMVTSNWNYVMEAYVIVSGQGAQVYFILFWLTAVVTALSVVLAAVLDKLVYRVALRNSEIDPVLLTGFEGLGSEILVTKRMTVKSY